MTDFYRRLQGGARSAQVLGGMALTHLRGPRQLTGAAHLFRGSVWRIRQPRLSAQVSSAVMGKIIPSGQICFRPYGWRKALRCMGSNHCMSHAGPARWRSPWALTSGQLQD
jgi:hypothetical protein